MEGTRLGPYEILGKLGAGGMGEVWVALDPRVGRRVAIKRLPEEFRTDGEHLARFEREARMLAALNHPNIAALYALEQDGQQRFMVLELVRGATLAERLKEGPLDTSEALRICRQIASALRAAHARGIVHRDLKPANVMLDEEGRAKVLDFGLAKPIAVAGRPAGGQAASAALTTGDALASTALTDLTTGGSVVGTVPYMSPEQVRGETLDSSTDIWSFGTLLFEIFAGKRAFGRGTVAEIWSAILDKEPDWDALPGDMPAEVRALTRRCLEKRAADRPQDLGEALEALRAAAEQPVAPRRRLAALGEVAAVLLVAAAGLALWLRGSTATDAPGLRLSNPMQITSASGIEEYPAWSPDGATLAFHSDQDGDYDIWLAQPGVGQAMNRTADSPGADMFPTFSPDGRQIAFWSERDGGGYYLAPVLAGAARQIAATGLRGDLRYQRFGPPLFSADGRSVLLVAGDIASSHAEIVDLQTGGATALELPGKVPAFDPAWSPDGKSIAFVSGWHREYETSAIRLLRSGSADSIAITGDQMHHLSPRWLDDRTVTYLANRGSSMDLWLQRLEDGLGPDGEPLQLTTGVGMRQAVFSPDRSKLAYAKGRHVANLWRVPILQGRVATWSDAEQLTYDDAWVEFVDVSPGGERLAISSDRAGNKDLWLLPAAGGQPQQLTSDPGPEWAPAWSPDGSQIAFYAYRDGMRAIWIMATSGGPERRLEVDGVGERFIPAWSPDGATMAFRAIADGNNDIYVVDSGGGEPRRLTEHPVLDMAPRFSPAGDVIVFASPRDGPISLWTVRLADGAVTRLSAPDLGFPVWSANGDEVYSLGVGTRAGDIWAVSFADGSDRRLTDFSGRPGTTGTEALATDGKWIYFTWEMPQGDIWTMDVASNGDS